MKLRFSRRDAPQLPLSGRYLTRLIILTFFCVIAIGTLSYPRWRDRYHPKSSDDTGASRSVQTAMVPSPFGELGLGVILADGRPKEPAQTPEMPRSDDSGSGELPEVDRQLLANVLDKTRELYQRPYYHLVTIAASSESSLLEERARRDISFAHLWTEPESFRGELVFLEGYLRGLRAITPTDNDFFNPARITSLYEGHLITEESQPNPYVIIMPRVPDGMPIGTNIIENVTFAGYFFKLWRYTAADNTERAAPLFIGQMLSWTPTPSQERDHQLSSYLAAGFVLFVMGLGALVWLLNRRSRWAVRSAVRTESNEAARAGLAELENMDVPHPMDAFRDSAGNEKE